MMLLIPKFQFWESLFIVVLTTINSSRITSAEKFITKDAVIPNSLLNSLTNDFVAEEIIQNQINNFETQADDTNTIQSGIELSFQPMKRHRKLDKIPQKSEQSNWITNRQIVELFNNENNYYSKFFLSMGTVSPTASAPLKITPSPSMPKIPSSKPTVQSSVVDPKSSESSSSPVNPRFNANSVTNSTDSDDIDKESSNPDGTDDGDSIDFGGTGSNLNGTLNCSSTTNGVYGSLEGTPFIVTFLYGVQTIVNMTETTLINDILPSMETAFNNHLLQSLFPSTCKAQGGESTVKTTSRSAGKDYLQRKLLSDDLVSVVRQSKQQRRRDQKTNLIGISARPSDYFADDLKCNQDVNVTLACFVLEGKISLFFENDKRRLNQMRFLQNSTNDNITSSDYQVQIRLALKNAMDKGEFNSGNPDKPDQRVKRVYYIDGQDSGSSINQGSGDTSSPPQDEGISSTLMATFVAIGGSLLVVASVAMYRRRQGSGVVGEEAENFDGDSTTMMPDGGSAAVAVDA